MVADRIPRIALPGDYYGDFGIRTIPNQTNDPGFPGLLPSRTNNPLAPGLRMPSPSNEASLGRTRVADAGANWSDFYGSVGIPAVPNQMNASTIAYYGKAPANFTGSDPFESYTKPYTASARRAPSVPNPISTGTTYYPQGGGVSYGYNTSTGDYEVKRAGQAYTSVPGGKAASPKGGAAPSVANPLPAMPYGLKAFTGSDPSEAYKGDYAAKGKFASGGAGKAPPVINLVSEPMSEVSGQNKANSFGKPVRGPSGKTYYPSNTPMSGVRAPYDPNAAAKYGAPAAPQAPARSGGLFGSLFGGGGGGGLFGGLFGGGAAPRAIAAPGVSSSGVNPGLGYNAAYAQSAGGDGQGNNGISESGGRYGGARSLTS